MKRLLVSVVVSLLMTTLFAQHEYIIKGQLKGAEGINLDEKLFFGDECSEEYLLDFEKLPDDCETFDFFESKGWVINDVIIKPN